MASFEVKVCKITVLPHPNADRLELAQAGAYLSAIPKGAYKTGDLAVYIPEQAILPETLIEELGLVGRLAGRKCNRVKAILLQKVLSQGIIYPNKGNWEEGEVLNEVLGITKYSPPIPRELDGEVMTTPLSLTVNYDIENFKRYPELLIEGEEVQITEKIHGTFSMFSAIPTAWQNDPEKQIEGLIDGRFSVSSKGLGSKGLTFIDCESNKENVYMKAAKTLKLFEFAGALADRYNTVVVVLGEIFGQGIQDLGYGFTKAQFRLFDIAIGEERIDKRYLDHQTLTELCSEFDIQRVPLLYVGEFSKEVLALYTNGKEVVSGSEAHIREGCVVKPLKERYTIEFGRVFLKSVSDDYLLRKNGTEHN